MENYIWKSSKVKGELGFEQNSKRMLDMNEKELSNIYNHCKNMLFNTSLENPGRFLVINQISDQINCCGVELLIRWFESLEIEAKYSRFSLLTQLRDFLVANKDVVTENDAIGIVYNGIPPHFADLKIKDVIKGCMDRLGLFDRRNLTKTFIIRQGIWFTNAEQKDFFDKYGAKDIYEKISMVRDILKINDNLDLRLNPNGLNYNELKAILALDKRMKYSSLSILQLEILRYKLLFSLEEMVNVHIENWEKLMSQIEEVVKFKNYVV